MPRAEIMKGEFSKRDLVPEQDLAEREVHLWRIGLDVSDRTLDRLRHMLSEDERKRTERFRFPILRRRFAAGRGALRSILANYLSMAPERLEFGYSQHGKPFLANVRADIHFNISHSHDLMVAAVCRGRPVGVDVEKEESQISCDRHRRALFL